jgi:hypothetical protein
VVLHLLDDKSSAEKIYAGVIEGKEAAIIVTNINIRWFMQKVGVEKTD